MEQALQAQTKDPKAPGGGTMSQNLFMKLLNISIWKAHL